MADGPGDRRVLERHEEMAPQREHAVSLGRGLGLGPVVGLFVRETQGPVQSALGMLMIGLILALCIVPIGMSELGFAPMWIAWPIVAGLLVAIVMVGRLFFRPGRRWWLYLYEGGFAALDHRGRVRESVRWDEIEQVDWEWSPHEDSAGASLAGYRLVARGGREVRLPIAFSNAYDPYAPVGGSLRTLSRGIDAALPQFPTPAESLDALAVQPLVRRARSLLDAGQPLVFGKVTLDPYGITYAKKPAVAWGEATAWQLDDGQLKIDRAPGRPKRLVIPMTQVEGGWILISLLAGRMPAHGR
jgi:hypothetical protein